MKIKSLAACAAAMAVALGSAHASLLGSFTTSAGGSGVADDAVDAFALEFGMDPEAAGGFGYSTLLFDILLSGDAAYNLNNGAVFDAAAALLTNGDNDYFSVGESLVVLGATTHLGGSAHREFDIFAGGLSDFQGAVITNIVLTLTNVSVAIQGDAYSYSYTARVDIFGDSVLETPLPAAAPLFLAGVAGAGFMRRRRKARA